ncbi:sulfite exporter TauE/SafE family protein [Streptosporangium sp. NBC_01756]|uniref:sulfite exporter TauE/SafE family protein n=1 Tax=Streptosporangium sp. NBC_01756 TaxID=2975950 RepID=UPI002DD924D7|nr:sulfite exporter TauE/SafE family protein [Streptosporangium sp. NBC_01756]WSC89361.1 sulfite exporter TauE/SafE family protein [Streptosporangium sp. NBC_01756]
MTIDLPLAIGSFFVAIVVGLTGMGGGALMTPMMMLFFNVPPLAAVSSDLVASAVMKPIGGVVHMRRGTVNLRLVGWLCAGSVPAAFCGVLVARSFGDGEQVQQTIKYALGGALLLAVAGLVAKAWLSRHEDRAGKVSADLGEIVVRAFPTLLVGMIGGLVVGISSVGSGSLIIVALLALYPALKANQLVGTDLVQAVPLVVSAALGHLLFGDFQLDVTTSLLAGSIPGVYLGARISARAPGGIIRALLAVVLLASALKLLDVGNAATLWILAAAVAAGATGWSLLGHRTRPEGGVTGEVGEGPQAAGSGVEPGVPPGRTR